MNKGAELYGFGDSLVEGHCIHVGMLDALAEKYEMEYHKYARNGASVIPCFLGDDGGSVPDVAAQVKAAPEKAPDFICFDGLTNDAYLQVIEHFGQISSSYDKKYDNTTFCGAFEAICCLLREKYMGSRIFYVCVHKMPTRNMEVQKTLQKAAREICEKWSVPHVDIFRRGQINTCIDRMRRAYSYDKPQCLIDGNGTHLNAEGYAK